MPSLFRPESQSDFESNRDLCNYLTCIECKGGFSFANTHTPAGWRETQITGYCEDCFDALMDELEDE